MDNNKWAKVQLTEEQAIEMAKSEEWKQWSPEQVVRFQLFQKRLCMDFSHFHQAMETVLNRPVFTHEFGLNYEGLVLEYLGEKETPSFEDIINLIPEEKRLIINI